MAMTQEQVFEKVGEVLVDALGVDEEEVTPQAKLEEDLGAESIDYLDINFRLEKAFGIKIDQSELFPEDVLNDPTYVQDGQVTDAGLAALKEKLPFADLSHFEQTRSVDDFRDVFTVTMLVKFVERKLGE